MVALAVSGTARGRQLLMLRELLELQLLSLLRDERRLTGGFCS